MRGVKGRRMDISLIRQLACLTLLILTPDVALSDPPKQAQLPKVVLIGDSIREGYAPRVAKELDGKATVISSEEFGQNSAEVLAHLDRVINAHPDVVHFNCGLRDLAQTRRTGQMTNTLERYEENLKRIVSRLQRETNATLVFATTTPVIDARHAQRKVDFDRHDADVLKYNEIALRVMKNANVAIDDLNCVVRQGTLDALIGADGVHFVPSGYDVLADTVSACLLKHLATKVRN